MHVSSLSWNKKNLWAEETFQNLGKCFFRCPCSNFAFLIIKDAIEFHDGLLSETKIHWASMKSISFSSSLVLEIIFHWRESWISLYPLKQKSLSTLHQIMHIFLKKWYKHNQFAINWIKCYFYKVRCSTSEYGKFSNTFLSLYPIRYNILRKWGHSMSRAQDENGFWNKVEKYFKRVVSFSIPWLHS